MTESSRLDVLRRLLLWTVVIGMVGMSIELLLLEHVEDTWQLVPFGIMAFALIAVAWHVKRPAPASEWAVRIMMSLTVLSGGLGVYLHYRGNVEFELEMTPASSGVTLFKDAMMGATPALAPGSMSLLGLCGLLYLYAAAGTRREPSAPRRVETFNPS